MKWEKYTLTKTNYDILKALDLSEMDNDIVFLDEENSFKTNNVDLLTIILNESICAYGLDANQDCTEYGRQLYVLYDDILYQNAEVERLDEELSEEELLDLKERMCGMLKPRRLTAEEIEQLKKENRI